MQELNKTIDDLAKSVITITETKNIKIEIKTFAESRLEYGLTWAQKVKGNKDAFPTPEEMMIGIY